MEKIDKLDRQILNIISKNARIPFKDVAEECGVSRAAIHQRVQRIHIGSHPERYWHRLSNLQELLRP